MFLSFGINTTKQWEPSELGQFLKLNRTYFVNREENMAVVNALKTFDAKVQQTVQRENKENGNKAFTFRQAVDSNIPDKFKLRIPIISGSGPLDIEVETFACMTVQTSASVYSHQVQTRSSKKCETATSQISYHNCAK